MRKKESEKAQLTISLTPASFLQLNEEARDLHTTAATLATRYIEEHLERKQLPADSAEEVETVKTQLADYKQHHEREISSLTTELTRLKAALDFETKEVARLKASQAKRRHDRDRA